MPAAHLNITGLVQGVFFRSDAQQKAQELAITGWVRNCDDGSVEIHAEGSEEKLKEFEEWCWEGPSRAKVTDVTAAMTVEKSYQSFEILF